MGFPSPDSPIRVYRPRTGRKQTAPFEIFPRISQYHPIPLHRILPLTKQQTGTPHLLHNKKGGQTGSSHQVQVHHQQINATGVRVLPGQATSKFWDCIGRSHCPYHDPEHQRIPHLVTVVWKELEDTSLNLDSGGI